MRTSLKLIFLGLAFLGVLALSGCGLGHFGHGYHHYGNSSSQSPADSNRGYLGDQNRW